MRKFIRFDDGTECELAPITYAEFMVIDLWDGSSDMAYAAWLKKNEYRELSSFDRQALRGAYLFFKYDAAIPDEKFQFMPEYTDAGQEDWLGINKDDSFRLTETAIQLMLGVEEE